LYHILLKVSVFTSASCSRRSMFLL